MIELVGRFSLTGGQKAIDERNLVACRRKPKKAPCSHHYERNGKEKKKERDGQFLSIRKDCRPNTSTRKRNMKQQTTRGESFNWTGSSRNTPIAPSYGYKI